MGLNIVKIVCDDKPNIAFPTHNEIIVLKRIKIDDMIKTANHFPKNNSFLETGLIAKYLIDPSLTSPEIEWQHAMIA